MIDGARWVLPGDWATVDADGSITLLGRGSGTINTGGEKVFPEEVEEALKEHPPCATWWCWACPTSGSGRPSPPSSRPSRARATRSRGAHRPRSRALASYKAPRRILVVPSIDRLVTGKHDYKRWKEAVASPPVRRPAVPWARRQRRSVARRARRSPR